MEVSAGKPNVSTNDANLETFRLSCRTLYLNHKLHWNLRFQFCFQPKLKWLLLRKLIIGNVINIFYEGTYNSDI
jgi:hypothetical protein